MPSDHNSIISSTYLESWLLDDRILIQRSLRRRHRLIGNVSAHQTLHKTNEKKQILERKALRSAINSNEASLASQVHYLTADSIKTFPFKWRAAWYSNHVSAPITYCHPSNSCMERNRPGYAYMGTVLKNTSMNVIRYQAYLWADMYSRWSKRCG